MHIACSPNCAIQLNKDKRVEAFNKETKELKAGLNRTDLKWQHKLTQKSFNKLRVLQEFKWFEDRGLEPECISCGKKNMDWCCGHLKTVGSAGRLRYDEKNTYLQCNRYCNMGLSGNINGNTTTRGYLNGLDDRFEPKGASVIKEYCEQNTHAKKWEWRELESMRESFNESIRNMDKP
jgi:hypothetical protein